MPTQLTNNAEALRLFLTEDIYLVKDILTHKSAAKVAVDEPSPSIETSSLAANDSLEKPVEAAIFIVEEPKENFQKTFDFKHKGKNQQGILILVDDAENDLSTREGTELLTKLMTAIKITGNDVALINYHFYNGAKFSHFYEALHCKLMLSFGVPASILATPSAELHGIIQYGSSRLIYTQHLHTLAGDDIAKRQLWNTLKTLI